MHSDPPCTRCEARRATYRKYQQAEDSRPKPTLEDLDGYPYFADCPPF